MCVTFGRLGLLSLVSYVCFVELLLMYIDHCLDWMGGFALFELYITHMYLIYFLFVDFTKTVY